MSLISQIGNPYLNALIIGVTYGLGACTASCLPYVAGYVAGIGGGFRRGIRITFIFNGGRILAYAIIGALIGLLSGVLSAAASNALSPFQVYSSMIFGVITLVIGLFIIQKARKANNCNLQQTNIISEKKISRLGPDFGAFSLGLSRGLIICPPLALLLIYALPFSTPLGSISLAVLFGIGTTISPLLILGGVTGWLLNKAPLFKKWISLAGGSILIAFGVLTIINSSFQ